jgi:hypothetical protein
MKSWYARVGLGITLCLPAIVGGCSEERPEINRVQPNGYPKSFFLGEKIADPSDDPVFFMRGYTVGHTHAQSEMTVGTGTGTDKIRWEITEDKLIARKAYQTVQGRDDKGLEGPDSVANGTVVASFNILSHYDIRRAYNDGTGEDLNVIDENTTDRPWNERDYMRVDWSSNEVVSSFWDNFFFAQLFGGSALVTPVSYAVTDPTSPDAPHYEPEDGYLDITARYQVYPATTETPWGSIPTCLFSGIYTGTNNDDCNAQEAVMRWSFWKRPSTDYEPFPNPTAAEDIIANFGSAGNGITPGYGYRNQAYDPQYGYIDDKSNWWVGRHNIWKASHIKDGAGNFVTCTSNGDGDNNGTADACQDIGYTGSAGSQCDTVKGLCTIPYRDREVRQLAYYLNEVFGDLYQDHTDRDGNFAPGAAEDLLKSWDQMFRNTVAYSREVECRRTGNGSREECHGLYFESTDDPNTKDMVSYGGWLTDRPRQDLAGVPTEIELQQDPSSGGPLQVQKQRVVVVCHNPVRDTDSKTACKPAGYVARYGDMRHNFMANWPNDARAPYGGVAHFSIDPESGEYFGNTALTIYIPGRARRQFDALLLQMGEITLDEYIEGVPGAIFTQTLAGKFNGLAKRDKGLSNQEIDNRLVNAARTAVGKLEIDEIKARAQAVKTGVDGVADIQKRQQAMLNRIKDRAALKVDTGIGSLNFANHQATITPLLGTQIESDLIDADLVNGTGNNPAASLTDDALLMASPLRGLDPAKHRALVDSVQQNAAAHGFCFGPESEAALTGSVVNASLAQYFANKYGGIEDRDERWSRMFEELEIESFKGVMLHEFGHSIGQRHQFASSFDSMNYMPQYWQLRTKEGQASAACAGGKNRLETFQGNGDGSAGKDVPANQQGDRLDNDTCMGPRYIDPPTADEMGLGDEPRPAIDYFAGTSTMEYQSERFSETAGLGTFDQHMVQAVYGKVLESFDANHYDQSQQDQFRVRSYSQLIDANFVGNGTAHYTSMARALDLHNDERCREATEEEKAKAAWRVVHGKVCAPPSRDHAAWDDFVSDVNPVIGEPTVKWHVRADHPDVADQVRWTYRYGESYSPAYIHTNLTDSGADIYEVTTNQIKQYESQYINSYFRRRNRSFTGNGTAFRTADSVYEVLRSYHWQVANNALRLLAEDSKGDAYLAAIGDDDDSRPDVMANRAIFDVLSQAVLMPQPGPLVQLGNQSASQGEVYDAAPIDPYAPDGTPSSDMFLGIDQGRFVDPDYDYSLGGSYKYTDYTKRAGFSGEKAFAFLALSDSRPTLSTISRENYLDGRTPALNFRNDFPEAFDRLMGGLLAEDWQAVAPSFGDCDGTGQKVQPLDLTSEVPARCQAPGVTLFPNVGYRQQFRSALFAQLYARENTDMTLVNKTRVWIDGLEGNISDAGFPKAEDRVEFYDPLSGYTYIARRFGTETVGGRAVERGIASRMLIRANELVMASYEVKQDQGAPMISPTGKISLELDAAGQPKELADGRKADLVRYRGLIDSVRQMGHILGEGPLLTERHPRWRPRRARISSLDGAGAAPSPLSLSIRSASRSPLNVDAKQQSGNRCHARSPRRSGQRLCG